MKHPHHNANYGVHFTINIVSEVNDQHQQMGELKSECFAYAVVFV